MTTEEALKHLSLSPAIGWQVDEWDRQAITTLMASVREAVNSCIEKDKRIASLERSLELLTARTGNRGMKRNE
jgi:hypothetical protein